MAEFSKSILAYSEQRNTIQNLIVEYVNSSYPGANDIRQLSGNKTFDYHPGELLNVGRTWSEIVERVRR